MKKFETPIVEVEKFEVADVITVSGYTPPAHCPDELPED